MALVEHLFGAEPVKEQTVVESSYSDGVAGILRRSLSQQISENSIILLLCFDAPRGETKCNWGE